jgi:Tat protein translocase TatB subunit
MLDVGMPEFMVIAVVALVVLGPERLPEIMGKIGRFYRQARQMSDQLLSEARASWDEGMREVESVGSTITDTWRDATAETEPVLPPPRLQQVSSTLEQPKTAAAAGPWQLHSWYRDAAADLEPRVLAPVSPTALAPLMPAGFDPALDDPGVLPTLTPAPAAAGHDLLDYELPADLLEGAPPTPPTPPTPPAPVVPVAPVAPAGPAHTSNGLGGAALANGVAGGLPGTAKAAGAPGAAAGDHAQDRARDGARDGAGDHAEGRAQEQVQDGTGAADGEQPLEPQTAQAVREQTIVALYRQGGIALESAAAFVGVAPEEFLDWVRFAEAAEAARAAARASR